MVEAERDLAAAKERWEAISGSIHAEAEAFHSNTNADFSRGRVTELVATQSILLALMAALPTARGIRLLPKRDLLRYSECACGAAPDAACRVYVCVCKVCRWCRSSCGLHLYLPSFPSCYVTLYQLM